MTVSLVSYATSELMSEAREVGLSRFDKATQLRRVQPYGDPGDDKRKYIDCWSSLAECLVAEWLGVPWVKEIRADLRPKPPDVGVRTDIKWTSYSPGHLITHADDEDDRLFVLVRKELPHMEVVGWTSGLAAKQKTYLNHPKARNPSDYWMPAAHLLMCEMLYQIRHSV